MEHELKPISPNGITQALAKVTHYRYLNQAEEAESICRDILAVDQSNQQALKMLGLVLTDQFDGSARDRYKEAEQTFQKLTDNYERTYYTGIAHERRAKAQLRTGHLPHALLGLFEEAMRSFAAAEKIRPAGNDDAVLRWNRCARLIASLGDVHTGRDEEAFDASDSAPM
jgi:tetratricopeptide (TPR) repeat protein